MGTGGRLFITAVAFLGKVLLDVKQGVVFEFGVRSQKGLQLLDREEFPLHVPGIAGAESLRQGPQQFQPGRAHGAVPLHLWHLLEVRRHLIQFAVKSGHLGIGKWRRLLLQKGAGKLPRHVIAQRPGTNRAEGVEGRRTATFSCPAVSRPNTQPSNVKRWPKIRKALVLANSSSLVC